MSFSYKYPTRIGSLFWQDYIPWQDSCFYDGSLNDVLISPECRHIIDDKGIHRKKRRRLKMGDKSPKNTQKLKKKVEANKAKPAAAPVSATAAPVKKPK
jgi:hypothetical protein